MNEQFITVLNKLDESFNLLETRNYGLSVIFSETGFSYAVLDFKRNKYLGVYQLSRPVEPSKELLPDTDHSFNDFLSSIAGNMPWLTKPYKLVKIAYEGKKSTLIPALLFNPDEKETYLNFSYRHGEGEEIFSDYLIPLDSHLVFSMPVLVLQTINRYFPGTRVVHFSSVLIESVWINYKNRINVPHLFLHLRGMFFDLMIFDGRQMTYYNAFPFQNPEDVAYYLIFVLEQLNFNPETIPLVLLGNIVKDSALYELLFRYIRHIEFGPRNEAYKYSYILNQIPSYACFPLLNFFSCGL